MRRIAAVLGNESAAPPKNGSLYMEDDWNETSSIKNNEAYWLSKACTWPAPLRASLSPSATDSAESIRPVSTMGCA